MRPYNRRMALVLFFSSIGLWAWAVTNSELRLGLLGIIEGLQPLYFVSLALLSGAFFIHVFQERPRQLVPLLHVAVLVFFIYLVPIILEGTPRNYHTYNMSIHSQYVVDYGSLEPSVRLLAYHNWPGAFLLASQLQIVTGLDILSILLYTPLISRLLIVPALAMLFGILTRDNRKVLLCVWFFILADFVGMNYLTGANTGYILFLLLVGMLVASVERRPGFDTLCARVCIILLFIGAVISHTLSPIAVTLCLGALLVYHLLLDRFAWTGERRRRPLLPISLFVFFGVLFLAWLIFGAETQLSIQLVNAWQQLFSVGLLQRSLPQDPSLFVWSHHAKMVIAGAMILFGGLGLVRGWSAGRDRHSLLVTVVMLVSLLGLLVFFYGAEIRNRLFLYGSPFVILLGVHSLDWRPARYVLLCFLLAAPPLHFLAHYGIERIEYVPKTEIIGAQWFYDSTDPSTVYLMPNNLGQFKRVEDRRLLIRPNTELDNLHRYDAKRQTYVWINWGAERFIDTKSGLVQLGLDYPGDFVASFRTWLESSPGFGSVYNNPHLQVYALLHGKR